jgi:type IV secretion system protein VirB1
MAGVVIDNDCARYVQAPIEQQIVRVESSFNPYAIGVVSGRLQRQPRNKAEAIATAQALQAQGWNFSMGCRQVNVKNLSLYGLTLETVFDAKKNSAAGTAIYNECLERASRKFGKGEAVTRAALSCYYSGNFTTGQRKEGNQPSYADLVLANEKPGQQGAEAPAIPVIPSKPRATAKGKASTVVPALEPRSEAKQEEADWDAFNEL